MGVDPADAARAVVPYGLPGVPGGLSLVVPLGQQRRQRRLSGLGTLLGDLGTLLGGARVLLSLQAGLLLGIGAILGV